MAYLATSMSWPGHCQTPVKIAVRFRTYLSSSWPEARLSVSNLIDCFLRIDPRPTQSSLPDTLALSRGPCERDIIVSTFVLDIASRASPSSFPPGNNISRGSRQGGQDVGAPQQTQILSSILNDSVLYWKALVGR